MKFVSSASSAVPSPAPSKPGGRRTRRLAAGVVAGLLAVAVLAGCLSDDQITVQKQINSARSSYGVRTLIDTGSADTKAQNWAQHLADTGVLAHSNLVDGYPAGSWCHLGENVGMGPSLASLQAAFMSSAPHRANILNPVYDHIGTGVVYKNGYYWVVQEFSDLC